MLDPLDFPMRLVLLMTAVVLSAVTLPAVALAQQPGPLSFFPHHDGDIWEYIGVAPPHYITQQRILEDSLGADGRFYVHHSYFGRVRIDTNNFEVRANYGNSTDYFVLLYKLDADSGDQWVQGRLGSATLISRVVGVYGGLFWGEVREGTFTGMLPRLGHSSWTRTTPTRSTR